VPGLPDASTLQSLGDLGLEPIDVVLMSGLRLGDQSSELERHLVRRFRLDNDIPASVATVVAEAGVTPSDPGIR
jgi:hypothetical protein